MNTWQDGVKAAQVVAELTHYLQGDIAGEPALAELRSSKSAHAEVPGAATAHRAGLRSRLHFVMD
jgi:hypothetical protein